MTEPLTPAQAKFKELLALVHADLKPLGFRKRGQNFYLGGVDNVGVLNFQKSYFGTKDAIRFTVNVGAWSRRLENAFPAGVRSGQLPTEPSCQWRLRIGHWVPESTGDRWWDVNAETDVKRVHAEVEALIRDHAAPFLNNHLSDEDLREYLREEHSGVGTKARALMFLAELISEIGPVNDLPEVLLHLRQETEGRPTERMARYEIERIEAKVRPR
jgi:hypothetical protein